MDFSKLLSTFSLRYFKYLSVLCVLCGVIPASALDRNAFTFTKYDLEVRLDPESHQIAARGKITLRNDSTVPQKNAALQISSTLDWRMIELDGQELEYIAQPYNTDLDHTGAANEANIKLPNAVAPKQSIELEVGYSGNIEVSTDRLKRLETPQSAADASEWDQISEPFTALRGIGYVLWYPVAMPAVNLSAGELSSAIGQWQLRQQNSEMHLKACWIAPQDHRLTVLSNGQFEAIAADTQQEDANTGCSNFRFATLGNTVPMLALGEFQVLQRPQMNLYYLGETKGDAEDFALAAEKVRPMITEWFGEPRSTLQIIDLPVPNGNPFESGTTLITPFKMDPRVTELTMAHTWVHASFTSPRPWIDEGLAHFAQALQRERQDGKKAAIAYLQARLPALLVDQSDTPGTSPAANALANTVDDNIYRNKGMYVWWMLRDMLGDHALQAAILSYRPEKDKEQSYMQRLLQAQTKQNLEWFFDDWVYRDRGLPDLRIEAATPRETLNGAFIVAVTVANQGTATANVPVIVVGENGESSARLQVGPKQKETTRVAVQGKPQQVTVNDGSIPEVQPGAHVYKFPVPANESSSSSK
jgi:hypothetical protein